jgi:biopolymer transport protein ExbD
MAVSVGQAEGVNLSIIITPMLDMAFQLLAFFVMTFHPHATEGHIDGKLLPPTKISTQGPKDATPKLDEVPVDPSLLDEQAKDSPTVIIKAVPKGRTEGSRTEGEPTQILLLRAENAGQPTPVADSDKDFETGLRLLRRELDQLQKSPSAGKGINIQADPSLLNDYLVKVYDVCKAAGYRSIGFVPPLTPGGQ